MEDGIISLEPNNDFVMGAPPGAHDVINEAQSKVVLSESSGDRVVSSDIE